MASLHGKKALRLKLNPLLFQQGMGRFERQKQSSGWQWDGVHPREHLHPSALLQLKGAQGHDELLWEVGRGTQECLMPSFSSLLPIPGV